jgi:hypothetical protein
MRIATPDSVLDVVDIDRDRDRMIVPQLPQRRPGDRTSEPRLAYRSGHHE